MKQSDSLTGFIAEDYSEAFLQSLGLDVVKQTTKAPFDFLVNGIRVDVKTCHPTVYGKDASKHLGWIFRIGKKSHTCDYYLLICRDENNKVKRRYLIPSEVAPLSMLTITPYGRCKYDIYREVFSPLFHSS